MKLAFKDFVVDRRMDPTLLCSLYFTENEAVTQKLQISSENPLSLYVISVKD